MARSRSKFNKRRVIFDRKKVSRNFRYRGVGALRGSGHRAGENWGDAKEIDPESKIRKYSKNSPSFDEGVKMSKAKRKALESLKN